VALHAGLDLRCGYAHVLGGVVGIGVGWGRDEHVAGLGGRVTELRIALTAGEPVGDILLVAAIQGAAVVRLATERVGVAVEDRWAPALPADDTALAAHTTTLATDAAALPAATDPGFWAVSGEAKLRLV
jgi:hypothetical protein